MQNINALKYTFMKYNFLGRQRIAFQVLYRFYLCCYLFTFYMFDNVVLEGHKWHHKHLITCLVSQLQYIWIDQVKKGFQFISNR